MCADANDGIHAYFRQDVADDEKQKGCHAIDQGHDAEAAAVVLRHQDQADGCFPCRKQPKQNGRCFAGDTVKRRDSGTEQEGPPEDSQVETRQQPLPFQAQKVRR